MKDWWQNLETRDQRTMTIAGIVIAILLFYAMFWIPLVDSKALKQLQVENNRQLLSWMTEQSEVIKQYNRTKPGVAKADSKRSLLSIVDSLAKQLGVRKSINRIDPDGPHGATIWIDNMNFDSLITLLGNLDKRNYVKVKEAEFTKLDKPGTVKAKIVLQR